MIGLLLLLALFIALATGGLYMAIIVAVIALPLAGMFLCLTNK